jgi:hypothetical protein
VAHGALAGASAHRPREWVFAILATAACAGALTVGFGAESFELPRDSLGSVVMLLPALGAAFMMALLWGVAASAFLGWTAAAVSFRQPRGDARPLLPM